MYKNQLMEENKSKYDERKKEKEKLD